VQFIATATIGFDHIDIPFCKEAGITWKNAPGCNAPSVAQYIQSVLLLLKKERGLAVKGLTMGIVGVGNVGSRIEKVAEEMGMRVLRHDPPREANEGSTGFVSLPQIMEESDIITFHVPLNKEGIYRTLHLADDTFFASLRKKPVIINTSRGEVIETQALLHALDSGQISDAIIDVWEHEPEINRTLLQQGDDRHSSYRRLFGRRKGQRHRDVTPFVVHVFPFAYELRYHSSLTGADDHHCLFYRRSTVENIQSSSRQRHAESASREVRMAARQLSAP
jgi:lactate dehydrogenase-like 2-hydroxyacid dehydrogenase